MGFPVITRLGVHQFWFNHWVNDFSYSQYFKQNKSLKLFGTLYLRYGLLYRNDIFVNRYFFSKPTKQFSEFMIKKKKKIYLRKKLYENHRFNVIMYYDDRLQLTEYFPMKTWLFRFNNWMVIMMHWFKPFKGKSRQRAKGRGVSNNRNSLQSNTLIQRKEVHTLGKLGIVIRSRKSLFYYF